MWKYYLAFFIHLMKSSSSFEYEHPQSFFFLWLKEQNGLLTAQNMPRLNSTSSNEAVISPSISTTSSQNLDPLPLSQNAKNRRICKESSKNEPQTARSRGLGSGVDCRDPCFNPKKQKKNRNVLSNLSHHLMKYLGDRESIQNKIGRVIRVKGMGITIDEFYSLLAYFEEKLKSYVTENCFKNMLKGVREDKIPCQEKKMTQFSKIVRTISYKFYREECISSILHSNKLSLQSKKLHLEGLKDIAQIIESLSHGGSPFKHKKI